MKILGGKMWTKMRSSRKPFQYFSYILIAPALLGLMLALMIVLLIPASTWTNPWSVALTYAILTILLALFTLNITRRVFHSREIDLEELATLLGIILSLALSLTTFGLSPEHWKKIPPQEIKHAEQNAVKQPPPRPLSQTDEIINH